LAAALDETVGEIRPETLLARVQGCWEDVVGAAIAAEAQPASERDGTLTVACRSALWAQEIELSSGDLLERLNAALGGGGAGRLTGLRPKVARLP
jgi:predicted nucleic acid-binding Zn ribbon protein